MNKELLELLKNASCINHYALKTKIYIYGLQNAFKELQKLKYYIKYLNIIDYFA